MNLTMIKEILSLFLQKCWKNKSTDSGLKISVQAKTGPERTRRNISEEPVINSIEVYPHNSRTREPLL